MSGNWWAPNHGVQVIFLPWHQKGSGWYIRPFFISYKINENTFFVKRFDRDTEINFKTFLREMRWVFYFRVRKHQFPTWWFVQMCLLSKTRSQMHFPSSDALQQTKHTQINAKPLEKDRGTHNSNTLWAPENAPSSIFINWLCDRSIRFKLRNFLNDPSLPSRAIRLRLTILHKQVKTESDASHICSSDGKQINRVIQKCPEK